MAPAEFPSNPQRLTPYPNFRFKIKMGDSYVAGVNHVSGLVRQTEVIKHREQSDPRVQHLAPGQTDYAPLTLARGVSYDPEFETWANKVFDLKNSSESGTLPDFRRDLTIELFNEAGEMVVAYDVAKAWVSEFHAMSELDDMGNATVIESMIVQNEGWSRRDAPAPE